MPNTRVTSPFDGNWDKSKETILEELGITEIADQPLSSVRIRWKDGSTSDIEDGEGKHYGMAFFAYCFKKYGPSPGERIVFTITPPMVSEAFLYYGRALWNDERNNHPSIVPFRRAITNDRVRVSAYSKNPVI